MKIILEIPDNKKDEMFSNIETTMPNLEEKEDGSAKYTSAEWCKEILRKHLIHLSATGKFRKEQNKVVFSRDKDLVS